MKYLFFVLIGLAGGVIGGMGMGGGTLLIPLLTISLGVEQKLAQSINLIAFIPMSICAIIIQAKQKNIQIKEVFWVAIPALITSLISAYCVKFISSKWLGKSFGIFLIVLAVTMLISQIIAQIKQKKLKNNGKNNQLNNQLK